ncbi:MAG TPA: WxL domain-containing protein [Chloroflexota bacterium]|nr:WxL domain-containing protein [Chloroflexota bacterium]
MFKTTRILAAAAFLGLGAVSLGGVAHAAGGATQVALTGGTLGVTGGSPGTFSATLTGSNQTADTTLGTYTVTDATGTGLGWNVTFQATQFTCTVGTDAGCKTGLTTLPWNSLSIAPPSAVCASGSLCTGAPSDSISSNTAIDTGSGTTPGSAVKVLSAAALSGIGSYTVTPGTIGTGQLELAIPGNALATTYHSTITITVNSGP